MRRSAWCAAIGLVLTSCSFVSTRPLYTARQSYIDSTLVGVWRDSAGKESIEFRVDSSRYDIRITDEKGKIGHFIGTLFRLDGRRVLDVTVGEIPQEVTGQTNELMWTLLIPAHGLVWIDWSPRRLAYALLKDDSLKAYLRRNPQAVGQYRVGSDSSVVLNDAPGAAQQFLAAFSRRRGVLSDSAVWLRDAR